ncbi:Patatin-like protein 7 [Linum perenne]
MAVVPTPANQSFDVDKLTLDIFSILENKFLFGAYEDDPKMAAVVAPVHHQQNTTGSNRVRILSIDGGGATDGILAATSLVRLQSFLRLKSGNPNAAVADYFDVVAGSGAGGILAALLFTKGRDGRPISTADGALKFLVENRKRFTRSKAAGVLRRVFGSGNPAQKILARTFGESTLKDTMKSVLIPCYDMSTRGSFLFSRADAVEMDGYDFKMSDVCLATSADPSFGGPVELRSVDKRTKIVAVNGGTTMNNPTAAAITHVLHNKQEFPLCNGVEDLLVVSLGNGEESSGFGVDGFRSTPARFVRIAGEGASEMVDQAVSMAFGECRERNYFRIQGNGNCTAMLQTPKRGSRIGDLIEATEGMLGHKNVESVLFKGKKMGENTNLEKLECVSGEVIKEEGKRKRSVLPAVVLKQAATPRSSSATTISTLSSSC